MTRKFIIRLKTQFNYIPSPLYPHAIHYRQQTDKKSHDAMQSLEHGTRPQALTHQEHMTHSKNKTLY